jgi:hypothetical protein
MNMKMGGNTVSSIGDYVAQVDVLKKRMGHSRSVLDGLEDSKGFMDADFKVRQSKIISDGFYLEDISSVPEPDIRSRLQLGLDDAGGAGNDRNALAYVDATGVCTLTLNGGAALPGASIVEVGDLLRFTAIQGAAATDLKVNKIVRVKSITSATVFIVENILGGDIAADGRTNFQVLKPRFGADNDALGKNEIEVIWRPPLSLFDVDHPMPMNCAYEMVLNPHTSESIQRRIVQSLAAEKTPTTDFKVDFEQVYLYLAELEGPPIEDSSFYLELNDCSIQTEQVGSSVDFSQRNFDVAPSTKAITVFYQDTRANSGTRVSDGLLRSYPNTLGTSLVSDLTEEQKLKRFYLQYAGQKYPPVDYDAELTGSKNHLTQLYIETLGATGGIFDNGGAESLKDWLERGLYLHFLTPKHGSDRSTRCSVHQSFQTGAQLTNMRVCVASWSTMVYHVDIKNGRVVNVKNAQI